MSNEDINLLKRDFTSGGVIAAIENKLRIAAWWSIISLLASGIIIGTLYVVLTSRAGLLEEDVKTTAQRINAQSVKEGILLSLIQRTDIAKKALDAARPWGNLFGILTRMAAPTQLHTLTIDEAGKVNVMFVLSSVDDAVTIVSNVIALTQQQILHNPQLVSFVIQPDGKVQMSLSFVPVL